MVKLRAAVRTNRIGFSLDKRTKIAVCALIATIAAWVGLSLTGVLFTIALILTLITIAGCILWILSEDLSGVKYLTIPALPIFYLGSYLLLTNFLGLRPVGIFAAGVVLGISFYILLLTQNIYNIAAGRSIGLIRAAAVSSTLFIVISAFLAYGLVWLQAPPFWVLTPLVFTLSFLLFILSIWSTHLEENITFDNLKTATVLSLVIAEIGLALSFWPILPLIGALVLSIAFYVVLGLTQFEIQGRLTQRVVTEYLTIAAVVLVLLLVTTSWGG